MIKNAATTKAASNTSPGLLLLFYITIGTLPLSWSESLPGAGRFIFSDRLVLTKRGYSKSKWALPDCFKEAKISYHKKPWKDGYFKSAGRGQEFVIMDNNGVEEWARNKIEESQIDR